MILELLDYWRELTERESEAIARRDWEALDRVHESKSGLQIQIAAAPDGGTPEALKLAGHICSLERANQQALTAFKTGLEAEETNLNQSARNIHQVSIAYRRPSEVHWQSFS